MRNSVAKIWVLGMAERVLMIGDPAHPVRLIEDPDAMDDTILSFFLDYWRSKRGQAILPLRNSFIPREVGKNLPWVVTADALPDYVDFRLRVVGSKVGEYYLGNGAGETLTEALAAIDTELTTGSIWLFARTCKKRIPLRATGPARIYNKVLFPRYDALYLPYSSDGENADRVVNIFTFPLEEIFGPRAVETARSLLSLKL